MTRALASYPKARRQTVARARINTVDRAHNLPEEHRPPMGLGYWGAKDWAANNYQTLPGRNEES